MRREMAERCCEGGGKSGNGSFCVTGVGEGFCLSKIPSDDSDLGHGEEVAYSSRVGNDQRVEGGKVFQDGQLSESRESKM